MHSRHYWQFSLQFNTLVIPETNSPSTICLQVFLSSECKDQWPLTWHELPDESNGIEPPGWRTKIWAGLKTTWGAWRAREDSQRSQRAQVLLDTCLFCFVDFFLLFLNANTFQNLMLICSYSRLSTLHYQCVTHSKHFQNGLKIGLSVITLKKIENLQQSDIAEYKDLHFLPWERTQNEVL